MGVCPIWRRTGQSINTWWNCNGQGIHWTLHGFSGETRWQNCRAVWSNSTESSCRWTQGLWLKASFHSYNPKPDPPANKGYPVMQSDWPGWCECSLRARVAQWWEHSPPTNVARVQIPASTQYVGWVCLFVVVSLPCSERFFSWYSGFPLSSKTNISKFQFDQESGRWRTTMWMCYLQIWMNLNVSRSRKPSQLGCLGLLVKGPLKLAC